MAQITLKGTPVETSGNLPGVGDSAPDAALTDGTLQDVQLASFRGKRVVLNIFPSVDTPVCAMSIRRFNREAGTRSNTAVLCISADLPFAQKRFCGAEGIDRVQCLSAYRDGSIHKEQGFGETYGVRMTSGPLRGLLARSVVVLDERGSVVHAELVPEIAQEPDYQKALAALD